jgi:hypothetical protein
MEECGRRIGRREEHGWYLLSPCPRQDKHE